MVIVSKQEITSGDVWVEISSPIGKLEMKDIDKALEFLDNRICGGMVKCGERYFVRHTMPIDGLSINEFEDPLKSVVLSADKIEESFIGNDQN